MAETVTKTTKLAQLMCFMASFYAFNVITIKVALFLFSNLCIIKTTSTVLVSCSVDEIQFCFYKLLRFVDEKCVCLCQRMRIMG